jgi:aminoglycoside phosphotransferase family enzyme/predicted kinase
MPHPSPQWQILETHVSVVVLTGEWAYKFKKPVSFGFLDYGSLERRRHFCERELELNRRYSQDLYLGLSALVALPSGSWKLIPVEEVSSGKATVLEYAVRMRQFPQSALLSHQLKACLSDEFIMSLADMLVGLHQTLPRSTFLPDEFVEVTRRWVLENFEHFESHLLDPNSLCDLKAWTQSQLDRMRSAMARRCETGHVRECHGDLHLDNVLFLDGQFQLFDGIEFNRELSEIDVINDLAFLLMELSEHGYAGISRCMLTSYLERAGDYSALHELRLYLVYRSLVRAKVDLIRRCQVVESERSDFGESGKAYLAYARRVAQPSRPRLYVMHGLSGSGKSTVAMQIVSRAGAIRVRSDWIRKRLMGHDDPHEKTSVEDLAKTYSTEISRATYAHLLAIAEEVLSAGFSVVADATFLKQTWREQFLAMARKKEVECRIVSCQASEQVLAKRLASRGADPSDATIETVRLQMQEVDAWTETELPLVVNATQLIAELEAPE